MARRSDLIQRKGRWYFNKGYPEELWPVVGSAPFRASLGTDSLEQAQRQRGGMELRYWAAVDAARRKLGEVSHLKINRAIATRYDQLANSFLGMVHLATARYWLKFVHAA